MKRLRLISLCVLILSPLLVTQDQTRLEHVVSVNVRIVPLYALDESGAPVHDLRKEDLRLLVNGRETPLQHLLHRDLTLEREQGAAQGQTDHLMEQSQARIVFILLDTIFNDRYGSRRMKQVALDIVRSGADFDRFVVIGICGKRGLFYIAGPEKTGPGLLEKMMTQNLSPMAFSSGQFSPGQSEAETREPSELVASHAFRNSENFERAFTDSLVQLRYALDLFVQPKIIYLLSQGFSITPEATWYLRDIVKAMNLGGGSLFVVNPGRDQSFAAGKASLMTMAEDSGGAFFQAREVGAIIRDIRKTTSAYYEAVFSVSSREKQNDYNIEILCSRKGVRILMPRVLARGKTYHGLSDFEKELYVINVIEGGLYARTLGAVRRAEFILLPSSGQGGRIRGRLRVRIPRELQDHVCDIYSIRVAKDLQDAHISRISKFLSGEEILTLTGHTEETLCFVIVCQETGQTIFGRLAPSS